MLEERKHKSALSVGSSGGGKDGKESVRDELVRSLGPMTYKEGMAMLSMEVSIVGMTWTGVAGPCGS